MKAFARPGQPHQPPPWRQPRPPVAAVLEDVPRANLHGTFAAIGGIAITVGFMDGKTPAAVATFAAMGTAISLAISVVFDLRAGVRNLIRADLLAVLAFYFLTLFEFLFPQPTFNLLISIPVTRTGILVCAVGLIGLLLGRHLVNLRKQPFERLRTAEIPAGWMLLIFWVSCFLGYLDMLLAVNFNVAEMIDWFMAPRFSQPWQRGRLGDWKAIVHELALFMYLAPPLGGIMIARRQRYGRNQLFFVVCALLLTFFYGFSSGTRNVFAAHLVTFIIGYSFALPPARRRELLILSAAGAVLMLGATVLMLQFRNIGFKNYLRGSYERVPVAEKKSMFVDYNLYAICRLVEVFPKQTAYLGWEVPYLALVRPIPRALWPGKPEGMSKSIEDAMGVQGLTIAASFAGEAFMAGGWIAVLAFGLFFGALAGWWSFLASPRNSELGILIYASGFFAAVISMRSLFVFTTALLPTLAAIVLGTATVRMVAAGARRLLARPVRPRMPPPRPARRA